LGSTNSTLGAKNKRTPRMGTRHYRETSGIMKSGSERPH
jgi:hypothetical protein